MISVGRSGAWNLARASLRLSLAAILVHPAAVSAQITGEIELRDGRGEGMVRNSSQSVVTVEIAIWESDESGEQVRLLRPASVAVWPVEVRLLPGESQTIRFFAEGDPYPANTMLRLETRFIPSDATEVPPAAGTSVPEGAEARLRMVTRILSKVWVR